ncbi:transposable element Tc1 transposase [Trichonephila clavipes]|nr:transposable element Tc1 transposase [Trichonephila clavipes]
MSDTESESDLYSDSYSDRDSENNDGWDHSDIVRVAQEELQHFLKYNLLKEYLERDNHGWTLVIGATDFPTYMYLDHIIPEHLLPSHRPYPKAIQNIRLVDIKGFFSILQVENAVMRYLFLNALTPIDMLIKQEDFGKRNLPGKRARRHFSQLSEFERGLIIGMKTAGWSTHRVAGQVDRRSVPLEIIGSSEDEKVLTRGKPDPTKTRSTIREDIGVTIVPQTISRHLAEANLESKRPFRALPLTPEHRQLRLQWCQARSMWNVTDWQNVVFSDESRLVLGTDDNRVRVWRRPGPYLNGLPGAIFQQDNALPHTARVAQDFLRHFLPWPARSPDLSLVEHVWDQLKRQMPSCHCVHDLELAVQDLWAHLPQDNIRCLINSMPDLVAACIADGGGPTRY